MSVISLNQSSYNSPTYSFGDVLSDFGNGYDRSGSYEEYPPAILFSAGCLVDNEKLNCTAACQDPSLIFTNPYTLQNCMVLASLGPTKLNANGSLTLFNQSLSPLSVEVANNFSVDLTDPDLPKLSSIVNATISNCLQQYCGISQGCDTHVPMCSRLESLALRGLDYGGAGWYCYSDICQSNGINSYNPDIGGIGVYISYWMQIGIAILLFFLLKICDTLLYRTCLFFYGVFWPWWFVWPLGLENVKETARKAQTSLHRYQPAIISATVEFHKAQCFFMLAIGIAGIIVLRQGSLEDGTLQSLVNYDLVGVISVNGILPVTLTLLCLHTVRMHSWYMLIISTCTVVLSTVTFFLSGNFSPSAKDIGKIEAATNFTYPRCGNKDPSRYCLNADYSLISASISSSDHNWAVIFSLVILGLLVLDYCGLQDLPLLQRFFKRIFNRVESFVKPKPRTRPTYSQQYEAMRDNTALDYVKGVSNVVYLFIWFWYAFNLSISVGGLSSFAPVNNWTFGQVVAITVWAAPIFEFGKLLVQGLKAGLDYRTPFPYKVVNIEDPNEEADSATEESNFRWTRPIRSIRDILRRESKKNIVPPGAEPEEVFKIF